MTASTDYCLYHCVKCGSNYKASDGLSKCSRCGAAFTRLMKHGFHWDASGRHQKYLALSRYAGYAEYKKELDESIDRAFRMKNLLRAAAR